MKCGELQHFQLYHNIVWLMPNLPNRDYRSFFSNLVSFRRKFRTIVDGPSIDTDHGLKSAWNPVDIWIDLYWSIWYYRSGVTGASFDVINSKCDILTVMWLYCAVYRTFLTRIWLFYNSLSNWKYVHEDFSESFYKFWMFILHEGMNGVKMIKMTRFWPSLACFRRSVLLIWNFPNGLFRGLWDLVQTKLW